LDWTYGEVGEQQRRCLVIGWIDDDVEGDNGGAVQPVAHADGQLVDGRLRPFAFRLDVVDETRGQVDKTEGFW